ncbi:hypothetical protein ABK040_002381 [Willaertia magna]
MPKESNNKITKHFVGSSNPYKSPPLTTGLSNVNNNNVNSNINNNLRKSNSFNSVIFHGSSSSNSSESVDDLLNNEEHFNSILKPAITTIQFIKENGKTPLNITTNGGEDDENKTHFEISCVSCRSKHRKCDRKLPSCSYCVARGIKCIYREKKKKGRQKKGPNNEEIVIQEESELFELYSSGLNNNNGQLSNNNNKQIINNNENNNLPNSSSTATATSLTIPQFKNNNNEQLDNNERLSIDPLVLESLKSSAQMEELSKQFLRKISIDDYCRSTSIPLINNNEAQMLLSDYSKLSSESYAFLYSINALMCQNNGMVKEAEQSFQKSRKLLSPVFDNFNNFMVASTYCNLSMFCSSGGRMDDAKFYLNFVDHYFNHKKNNEEICNLQMVKCVSEMSAGIAALNSDEFIDIEDLPKLEVGNLLVGFYKFSTGQRKVPAPIKEIVSKRVNNETLKYYLPLLELVSKLFSDHERNRVFSSKEQENIARNIYLGFVHGTRVLMLLACGFKASDPFVQESATEVINLAFIGQFGLYGCSLMTGAVSASCSVFLKIIEEIESGMIIASNEEIEKHYEMVRKGLSTMLNFSRKLDKVNKLHGDVLEQLQRAITNHDRLQLSQMLTQQIQKLHEQQGLFNNMVLQGNNQQPTIPASVFQELLNGNYPKPNNNNNFILTPNNNAMNGMQTTSQQQLPNNLQSTTQSPSFSTNNFDILDENILEIPTLSSNIDQPLLTTNSNDN